MEFRPCIDIHNGLVKQIVGSTLEDVGDMAKENFVSKRDADFFAEFYASYGLRGGHVILLNGRDSEYYEATKAQAMKALKAYPGGLQVGGGIRDDNAYEYISAGASHVIVTSYVFSDGRIQYENLEKLVRAVGSKHIVLDLSCKKYGDEYVIVTDRWQKRTEEVLSQKLLDQLSDYCDEFLIHAAHVEGMGRGIDEDLVSLLGSFDKKEVTYAGGVHEYEDIERIKTLGSGRVNVTIGSALDLFGGPLNFEQIVGLVQEV